MAELLHKNDIRKMAAARKRRNALWLKIGIIAFGVLTVAAWVFLFAL